MAVAELVAHSRLSAAVHGRTRPVVWPGRGRSRPMTDCKAQFLKACEGASLPWVQIPPPPPLTCDDASHMCLLPGGGHRCGLSFRPQMVSVDRAEIPAAGCIGPELRPCPAADVRREQIPEGDAGASS